MRTIRFPIEGESPEIIEYLLDTVLMQNGSVILDKADVTFEVSTLMEPTKDSWYNGTVQYIINLTRCPKKIKNRNARYTGWVTDSITEVKGIINSFNSEEVKPHHKKYTKVKKEYETPWDDPMSRN